SSGIDFTPSTKFIACDYIRQQVAADEFSAPFLGLFRQLDLVVSRPFGLGEGHHSLSREIRHRPCKMSPAAGEVRMDRVRLIQGEGTNVLCRNSPARAAVRDAGR